MVSPFEFDESPPDVGFEATRLPRRQAGSAPQGLAVTLLADYSLRTRAWLPSAAIVALLGEANVTTGAARTAISRLARRGALENHRQGRFSFYRLTRPAASTLALGGRVVASFVAEAEAWDGWWTLVAFSLPQEKDAQRRALRSRLRWLGYEPLYDALWVSPRSLAPEVTATLEQVGRGAVTVFRARHVDPWPVAVPDGAVLADGGRVRAQQVGSETDARRGPLDAWDLAEVARRYEAFVERWSPLAARARAGDVGGVEALQARTGVMESYRHFVVLDPFLPMRLMPSGWLRERAREVYVAVYDGLAEPALRHVMEIVSSCAEGPLPDLATHTVAELLTGVAPPPGPASPSTPPRDAAPPGAALATHGRAGAWGPG